MNILVIGGSGFIGSFVVRRLVGMDHQLVLFNRGRSRDELPEGTIRILGDRRQLADFAPQFRRLAPEVVLDMIPLMEAEARTVMSLFQGIARRVVAISSQDVYRAYGRFLGSEPGPVEPVPLGEEAPLRRRLYPYRGDSRRAEEDPRRWMDDYDKIPVEWAVLGDPHLPGTVLRLPMVYGPEDRQHRLFEYLKRMGDGRPAILLDEGLAGWRWTRGYVENVAAAIALAVTDERAAGRVYNVGQAEALTTAEWVCAIGRAAGWMGEVIALPRDHLPPHLRAERGTEQDLVVDTMRIRRELGYREPVPLDVALRRTVAWERGHPPETFDPAQFDYAAEDALLGELGALR